MQQRSFIFAGLTSTVATRLADAIVRGKIKRLVLLTLGLVLLSGCSMAAQTDAENAGSLSGLERVTQQLVPPPRLPKHEQVAKGKPKIVQVRLEVQEKEIDLGDGTKVPALTYNGSIPGPIIVVHQDDYVELTLVNPKTNTLLHNIDLHAATGALGGAAFTKVSPGQKAVLRFKATRPGVFVYHCAPGGSYTPFHVAAGMNGAIMVLPRGGLKDDQGRSVRYDRAYYIGEQSFYVPQDEQGVYRRYDSPLAAMPDTVAAMKTLTPTHIVFNGGLGALTGDNALQAKAGEKVLFIHSQANGDSRPHLIGGHGDLVWEHGSFAEPPKTNLETWFIPGGTAVAMLYEFRQPGTYVYLNHNLIEGVLLGAAAHVQVKGEWDPKLMEQVAKPATIVQ